MKNSVLEKLKRLVKKNKIKKLRKYEAGLIKKLNESKKVTLKLYEDENVFIFNNILDKKLSHLSNVKFICMLNNVPGDSEINFHNSLKPLFCDDKLLDEKVSKKVQETIEKVLNQKFVDLLT